MPTSTETLLAYARLAPVIPVVTIEDARRSIDLAQTLVAAGLPVVEVTLRTAAAMDAIAAIAKAVPEAVIAAGTVTEPSQIREVADAGAKFIVTPGTPVKLAEALADAPIPVMPGCATPSEAMTLIGDRLPGPQILPRRRIRRNGLAQGRSRPAPGAPLLPYGRYRPCERAELPRPAERRLRRRHLDGAREGHRGRRFRGHRSPRARGRRLAALNHSGPPLVFP